MIEDFDILKNLGDENLKQGKYSEAIKDYSDALNLDNFYKYKVYLNRCLAYFKLEKYEEALEDATQACTLNKDYAKAWGRVGSCLLALNRYKEATTAFDRAHQLEPSNEEYKKLGFTGVNDNEKENDDLDNKTEDDLNNKTENDLINELKKLKSDKHNFIENLPIEGLMGNMFKKMMKNKKMIQLASDDEFNKNLKTYKKNPFEAMKNPMFLDIMNEFINELNN